MTSKPRSHRTIWRYLVELALIATVISFALGGVIVWHSTLKGAGFVGLGTCLLVAITWYDRRCRHRGR